MALLELVRLFHKLFETYGTWAKYDLMFLLTPSGSLNYKGTEAFLNDLPEGYGHSVVFALCLDSLGWEEELNLHVSRLPKTNERSSLDIFEVLPLRAPIGFEHHRATDGDSLFAGAEADQPDGRARAVGTRTLRL